MRLTQWLGDFGEDVRFAVRQMRASVGFTLVATADAGARHRRQQRHLRAGRCHAAATAAVPGVRSPRGARRAYSATVPRCRVSVPTLEDVRNQSRSFEELAAIQMGAGGGPLVTAPDGSVETVERQSVSTRFFDVLGVVPVAGRTFRASDEAPTADRRHLQREPVAGALQCRRVAHRQDRQAERSAAHAGRRGARRRPVHASGSHVDADAGAARRSCDQRSFTDHRGRRATEAGRDARGRPGRRGRDRRAHRPRRLRRRARDSRSTSSRFATG